MHVYVIGPASGPYKVGITSDLPTRLEAIQTGSPVRLQVHHIIPVVDRMAALVAERAAHMALAYCRQHGEWFDCPLEHIVHALSSPRVLCIGEAQNSVLLDHGRREVQDFAAWMLAYSLTIARVSHLLGCSRGAVTAWRKDRPPRYVLMACYALTIGLEEVA